MRQSVGGVEYDETVAIPKCAEAKVLEAATWAVKAGLLWVTNGPMSFCGEEPAAGAIAKTAVLRSPPAPIALTALTPGGVARRLVLKGALAEARDTFLTVLDRYTLADLAKPRLRLSALFPVEPRPA